MATIIDALVVTLGLDNSDFRKKKAQVKGDLKDTGDDAEKSGKRVQQSLDKSTKSFENVAKSAARFLAVVGSVTAIKGFIERQIEANSALDRFSRNLNESVSTISAWSNAAEQAGGTAEGLQGTMDMLSKSQTDLMLRGESGLIPYFSALGVSMADAEGKARPVSDILLDLSDRFEHMDRTSANNMGAMMGIDQGTMNLLLKGRTEVETLIKRQKEYGAVTKQQAEQAARLKLLITQNTQEFAAFGRELLARATPAIESVLNILTKLGSWIRENQTFVEAFLTIIAAGLVAIGLAATPINLTVVAILALAAGFAALYDDYKAWSEGANSLFDWTKFERGVNAAKRALRGFADVLGEEVFYRMFAFYDAATSSDKDHAKWAWNEFIQGGSSAGESRPAPSTSAPARVGSKSPRGIRNNNPGNLNFAGQAGATKEGGPNGRFAKFGTMREGVAALVRQIGLYVKRGKNTIREIIDTYAPPSENNTGAYIAAVSKALGIGADEALDPDNASQVMALVKAIAKHETGGDYLSDADITAGYNLAGGIKGASNAARGAGAGRMAAANSTINNGGSSHVENHIGEVTVVTQATDAAGIAKDMGSSLEYLFVPQANYGPS